MLHRPIDSRILNAILKRSSVTPNEHQDPRSWRSTCSTDDCAAKEKQPVGSDQEEKTRRRLEGDKNGMTGGARVSQGARGPLRPQQRASTAARGPSVLMPVGKEGERDLVACLGNTVNQ